MVVQYFDKRTYVEVPSQRNSSVPTVAETPSSWCMLEIKEGLKTLFVTTLEELLRTFLFFISTGSEFQSSGTNDNVKELSEKDLI